MDVWAERKSSVQKWASTEVQFMELWKNLYQKLNKDEVEWVAAVMRGVWLRRNTFLFEKKFGSPSAVVKQAEATLEEFQLAQRGDQKGKGCPAAGRRVKWKAPGDEVVKVNWDAGVNLKEERTGIGVVVRDDKGEVLVALCSSRGVCCSPVVAELHALWRAMKLCAELNFEKVIFEGDSLIAVKAVNSEKENWE
ncbi:uncharacterized protein LOC122274720 [Carya illinoinensis]|uniref:uncharacterized protein LOC122274720 n=1 Tax=Carya illinoinensis TaxID=32201 RepID=UPI001C71A6DF|nr:uncharacterized protein LOC122274720 [Carya illinoinensis]